MKFRISLSFLVFLNIVLFSQTLNSIPMEVEASTSATTGTHSFSGRWGFGLKEGSEDVVPLFTDDNMSENGDQTSTVISGREYAPAVINNTTDTFLENDDLHNLNGYYRFYVNNLDDLKIIYDFNYGASDGNILSSSGRYFILYRHSRQGSTQTFNSGLSSITNQFNNISVTSSHFEFGMSFVQDQYFKLSASATNITAPLQYKSLFAFSFIDLLGSSSVSLNEVVIKFHMQVHYGGFLEENALKFAIIVDGQTPSNDPTDLHGPRIFGLPIAQFEADIIPIVLDTNKPWWTAHKSGQSTALSDIYLDQGSTYQKTNLDGTSGTTVFSNADVYYVSFLDYLKNGTQTRFRAPLFSCTFNGNPCVAGTTFSPHLNGSDGTPINSVSATINNSTATYFQTEYWIALQNQGLYTFNVIEFSGKTSSFSVRIDRESVGVTVFNLSGLNSNAPAVLSGSTFYQGFGFRYSNPDKSTTVTIKNTSNNSIAYQESFLAGSINQVILYTTSNFNAGGSFTIEIVDQANNKAYFDSNPALFIYSLTLVAPKYNLTIDQNAFNPVGNRTYIQSQDPQTLDFSSLNAGNGYGQWQLTMSNSIRGSIPISYEESQFRGLKLGNNVDDNTPDQVKLLTKNIIGTNAAALSNQNQIAGGFPKIKAVVLNLSTEASIGVPNSTVSLKVNNTVFANSSRIVNDSSSLSQDRYLTFEDTNGDIGHLEMTINHYRARPIYIREISIFALADNDLLDVVNFANDLSQYDTCDFNDAEAAFIQLNSRYQDFSNTQKSELENLLVLDYGSQGVAGGKFTLVVTAANKWRGLLDISEDNIWGNAQLNSFQFSLSSFFSTSLMIVIGNFLTFIFFFKFKKGV